MTPDMTADIWLGAAGWAREARHEREHRPWTEADKGKRKIRIFMVSGIGSWDPGKISRMGIDQCKGARMNMAPTWENTNTDTGFSIVEASWL